VADALDAGALGYVLKTDPIPVLVEALQRVHQGERFLSPALGDLSGGHPANGLASSALAVLSLREREVFHLAARGLANTEIARELCISRKTVETHKYRLQKKLGLHNAHDLLQFAAAHGLIRRARRDQVEPPPGGPGAL
jgi:DNA-binding NarL/FixJ family response regulator